MWVRVCRLFFGGFDRVYDKSRRRVYAVDRDFQRTDRPLFRGAFDGRKITKGVGQVFENGDFLPAVLLRLFGRDNEYRVLLYLPYQGFCKRILGDLLGVFFHPLFDRRTNLQQPYQLRRRVCVAFPFGKIAFFKKYEIVGKDVVDGERRENA